MVIKSIRLANFQCYYGTENEFTFSEGLNVIIGDNTAGKSKLYDAFYWVVYNRLPSYKNQPTEAVKEKFVHELAKSKALEKKPVKVEVELTFRSRGTVYQFVRSYNVWRDGYEWKSDPQSKEKAYRYDVLTFKPFEDVDMVKQLIMNEAFKPYMWFQGEQVEAILDFEQPETLKKAIEVLSGVKQFEDIKNIVEGSLNAAKEALKTQLNRSRKVSGDVNRLSTDIDDLRSKLATRLETYNKVQSEVHKAEKRREELHFYEQDSKDLTRINGDIVKIGKRLARKKEEIETQTYDMTKNLFSRYWLLVNAKPLQEAFEKKFEDYRKRREDREIAQREQERERQFEARVEEEVAMRSRLPKDVPDAKYLREMLREHTCFVCNRPFELRSEAEKHIQLHLNPLPKTTPKESRIEPKYHNFYNDLRSLDRLGQEKCKGSEGVKEEVSTHIFKMRELESERDNLESDLEELQNERSTILSNLPKSSESMVLTAAQEINQVERDIRDGLHRLGSLDNDMKKLQKELEGKEKEYNDLAAKNLSSPKYSLTVELLSDLYKVTDRTRQRVFQELVERLEDEANKHYETITINNQGFRGRIKLERIGNSDEYAPKIVSSNGAEVTALNQSNLTLVKLSVIMAIITGRRASNTADMYPLISDAPTSTFSENYIIGFCKHISEVYRQSIIMSKEFCLNENLRTQLFKEVPKLGKVYTIETRAEDGLREDLTATNTQIKLLKA